MTIYSYPHCFFSLDMQDFSQLASKTVTEVLMLEVSRFLYLELLVDKFLLGGNGLWVEKWAELFHHNFKIKSGSNSI